MRQPLKPVEEQVVVIYAGTRGYLDPIPVGDVRRLETELREFVRTQHADVLDGIRTSGEIADVEAFEALIKDFASRFVPSESVSG